MTNQERHSEQRRAFKLPLQNRAFPVVREQELQLGNFVQRTLTEPELFDLFDHLGPVQDENQELYSSNELTNLLLSVLKKEADLSTIPEE